MLLRNSWIDSIILKSLFKLINSIIYFACCFFDFHDSHFIEFMSLLIFELKLTLFSFFLV
jgi:hypothetical protein